MAWETRKGKGRYYTRTCRHNGRIIRLYFGGGELAEHAARIDADRQRRSEQERQQVELGKGRFESEKEILEPLEVICTGLLTLTLQAAGFCRHNRGEWRKRMIKSRKKQLNKREKAKIDKLVEKATAGDDQALAELKTFDEGLPAKYVARLIDRRADSGKHAERLLIGLFTRENLIAAEALSQGADALRAEIAGADTSPLERLLGDRIVACWLHVNEVQTMCVVCETEKFGGRAESGLQIRLSYAHRRFLQACKALAQVRKLLKPNIQVNIGEKQINMMGSPQVREE